MEKKELHDILNRKNITWNEFRNEIKFTSSSDTLKQYDSESSSKAIKYLLLLELKAIFPVIWFIILSHCFYDMGYFIEYRNYIRNTLMVLFLISCSLLFLKLISGSFIEDFGGTIVNEDTIKKYRSKRKNENEFGFNHE